MSDQPLPSGWHSGHISDIATINPSVSVASIYEHEKVTFLTMADVGENGRIQNRQIRRLDEVRAGFTRFEEGDVLFAKITPCMQNGKGAFARGLLNRCGFGSTEFHVLRANSHGDSEFLFHLAQSHDVRVKAIAFFTGSAGQQRVDAKFFSRYPLLIPPPCEQHKIARILTTVDDLIEKTETLIAKYQAVKQGMMHDLFTRGVDDHGQLRPTYEEAPELYKQSELGWIPKAWTCTMFGTYITSGPQNGLYKPNSAYSLDGSPIVRIDSFYDGKLIATNSLKRLFLTSTEVQLYTLAIDDILVNRVNSIDFVGKSAIVPCLSESVVFESNIMRLTIDRSMMLPQYAINLLCSHIVQRQMRAAAKSAIAQASINQTDVKRCLVPVPQMSEQDVDGNSNAEGVGKKDRLINYLS